MRTLYVGVTRDGLTSTQLPSRVLSHQKCHCDYCGIFAVNDPEYSPAPFYSWKTLKKEQHTACGFCAQTLNINTIGQQNGSLAFYTELTQVETIWLSMVYLLVITTTSSVSLDASTGDRDAKARYDGALQTVSSYAEQLNTNLTSVSNSNFAKLKIRNNTSAELAVFASALKNEPDYARAVKNTARYIRYLPTPTDNNRRLIDYFHQHHFAKQFPEVDKWVDFAKSLQAK